MFPPNLGDGTDKCGDFVNGTRGEGTVSGVYRSKLIDNKPHTLKVGLVTGFRELNWRVGVRGSKF